MSPSIELISVNSLLFDYHTTSRAIGVPFYRVHVSESHSRSISTGSRVSGYIVGYGRFIPEVYRVVLPGTQETYTITGLSKCSGETVPGVARPGKLQDRLT